LWQTCRTARKVGGAAHAGHCAPFYPLPLRHDSQAALPREVRFLIVPVDCTGATVTTAKNVRDPADVTGHVERAPHRQPRGYLAKKLRPIPRVLLPFAAGFYLTILFRTINALISGQLTSDLALRAADIGLLTSVYFLTFAAAQIPIGSLLDRYGPRRVQSALLFVAAGGAALFGASQGFPLVLARALIGLGVAAALTAGVKSHRPVVP